MAKRLFGHVAGTEVGDLFANRRAAFDAGVHRHLEGGICGGQNEGAESVVVNDGYEDDLDLGDTIIYTGQGGNIRGSGRQSSDQEFVRGNRALAINKIEGIPVRVLRGPKTEHGPESGFRYDGLFYVDKYWEDDGKSGFKIWRYLLVRETTQPVATDPSIVEPLPGGESQPKRKEVITQRVVRNTGIGSAVKAIHSYQCQICGEALETPAGRYAEAAHIRPLGRPHEGPDTPDNVLCLCPNHHVLFDAGSLFVRDDLMIVDGLNGTELGRLNTRPEHIVSTDSLAYHRDHWTAERTTGRS